MVNFFLHTSAGKLIECIDACDALPDKVASIRMEGPFDSNKSSYRLLTKMLESSKNKLEEIEISQLSAECPEFLAFIILISRKTKSLEFCACPLSTNAMSCLLGALLSPDGISSLRFDLQAPSMPTNQAEILFRGIASSPCLESLDLDIHFSNRQTVSRHLIHALRQNQSLKKICIDTNSMFSETESSSFPDFVKASILCPNVKDLSIKNYGQILQVPIDVLQDVLCRKDCILEKLHLSGVDISTGDGDGLVIQNTSVKSLALSCCDAHDSDRLSNIIRLFKSVEGLDVSASGITQLSFLDSFLVRGKSKLKSLDLSDNQINKEEMLSFSEKLRKTSGLKSLAICENPAWEDGDSYDVVSNALMDVLRQSTDLEHVDFDREDLQLDLNRGGRRAFESSSQPFPRNLLPLVLERASKISYYRNSNNGDCLDSWGWPTDKKARADVVYWMIQRLAPQL